MPRLSWIRLWINESLKGTIRFDLDAAERSIWYDLLLLGGDCRIGGQISSNEQTAFPHGYIATMLRVPLDLLEQTLVKLKASDRIREDETGLYIINWKKYQCEYDRQKPYREAKAEEPKEQLLLPTDEKLATISTLYEENVGAIVPMTAERLKDIAVKYPAGWFEDAMAEAVKANVRKLNYIEKILETWAVEGKGGSKPKGSHKKGSNEAPDWVLKGEDDANSKIHR